MNTNVSSVLKNVTDIVTNGQVEMPNFWEFAYINMQNHERERFSTLTHVWTDRGKARALIRAALNERSLERYILTWLDDPSLSKSYEVWALMRDPVTSSALSSMAAELSSILFALTIDKPELNAVKLVRDAAKPEPIIAAPSPTISGPSKKSHATKSKTKRQIIDFENDETLPGTPPKESLSTMCLKQEDTMANHVSPSQVFNIHEELPSEIQTFVCRPTPPSSRMSTSITSERSVRTELFPDLPPAPSTSRFLCEDLVLPSSSATDSGVETSSSRLEENNNDDDGEGDRDEDTHSVVSNASSPSRNSSVHSSAVSTDMERLKDRLKDAEERCEWLESRVAQLSLENHRLRGISNSPRGGLTFFTVSVPRVHLEDNKYYSYEIQITPTYGGEEWTIRKRYRDFYNLHQTYQKSNPNVKALDFPPKKKFGNMVR